MSAKDHLNVEANGDDATPEATAAVFESVARTLRMSPEGTRYDFKIEVVEQ